MIVIVRPRWRSAVLLAVLLHFAAFSILGLLLPEEEEMPDILQEVAWIELPQTEDALPSAPEKEETSEPQMMVEEGAEPEPSAPEPPPPKEAATSPQDGEKKADGEKPKPVKKRDYPRMRKPNKPAVLREETKRGLSEKETPYRGHVEFFVDVSTEGRVTGIQAWQFEPEIADEKKKALLQERLEKRIKESRRYAPSLTPEGAPTTQTKAEELEIPEKKQPEDVH